MMKSRFRYSPAFATTLTALFALSACGIKGELETPPPLWGKKDKAEQSTPQTPPPADPER